MGLIAVLRCNATGFVSLGSIAAHSGCPRDVRFPPDRDRISVLRASLAPRFFYCQRSDQLPFSKCEMPSLFGGSIS